MIIHRNSLNSELAYLLTEKAYIEFRLRPIADAAMQ